MQSVATNKDDIGFAAAPIDDSGVLKSDASPDWRLGVSKSSDNKKEAEDFLFAFVNSSYADTNGFIPINKNKKSTNPTINAFLASGVKLLYVAPGPNGDESDKKDKIANNAAIDFMGGLYTQNVALAAKSGKAAYDKAIDDLNTKWNNAKKELNY